MATEGRQTPDPRRLSNMKTVQLIKKNIAKSQHAK